MGGVLSGWVTEQPVRVLFVYLLFIPRSDYCNAWCILPENSMPSEGAIHEDMFDNAGSISTD